MPDRKSTICTAIDQSNWVVLNDTGPSFRLPPSLMDRAAARLVIVDSDSFFSSSPICFSIFFSVANEIWRKKELPHQSHTRSRTQSQVQVASLRGAGPVSEQALLSLVVNCCRRELGLASKGGEREKKNQDLWSKLLRSDLITTIIPHNSFTSLANW